MRGVRGVVEVCDVWTGWDIKRTRVWGEEERE
jgi:hypothetical protein